VINDERLALFVLLGQSAGKAISVTPEIAHSEPLTISETYDLSASIPEAVKEANSAAVGFRLFYVFENYLRQFVFEVLSAEAEETWWDKIPTDVKDEVEKLEEREEQKAWMSVGARDKSALMTYPQLLRVIEHCWKDNFEDIVRDKALLQEARHIAHLRNTLCHMSNITEEEVDRIRQIMRDWFRVVAP